MWQWNILQYLTKMLQWNVKNIFDIFLWYSVLYGIWGYYCESVRSIAWKIFEYDMEWYYKNIKNS